MTADRRSPVGLAGSLVLHGAIVVATLFTFSHTLEIADQSPPVVPIDLVTIAQKTNIRAAARPAPHVAPTPAPPVPKAMPAPTPPQVEPAPAPKEAPTESVAETPPPKAEPIRKPKPPQEEQEKKKFDVDKVLALLNKVSPRQAAAPDAPNATRTVRGFGAQTAMTADLQDALRSQIQPCWSPPVGAPHPERLVVSFDLFLNPDGSIAQSPQLLESANDPFLRAAADAARRAIYTCAPYKLPADRYQQWREINPFVFDPRQMLGQE